MTREQTGETADSCEVLATRVPLSFWGGVDPESGEIVDRHHPLCGSNIAGRILVMPHGRGSCTGSVVLLEAIHAGVAPAAIVLNEPDEIIGLGAIVADEVLQRRVPVIVLDETAFAAALRSKRASLDANGGLSLDGTPQAAVAAMAHASSRPLALSDYDQRCLAGDEGPARRVAMRVIRRVAQLQGAHDLIDVSRVHVDGCIYTGPAGLAFAERLAAMNGRVAVPTTLNSISVDRRQWRTLGVPEALGLPATRLAQAYVDLGAQPTYTCAPYLLGDEPRFGERIAWAESNAVVYANSVLGARTDKTPDLLDICIALTGRAPETGCYLDAGRRAQIVVSLPDITVPDDALYPLAGYVVGQKADSRVPVVTGLEEGMSLDALKAFGAAFATTSSAGMFHIVGVTPEAETVNDALAGNFPASIMQLSRDDLVQAWQELGGGQRRRIDLVALGNPHFSCSEFADLAALCAGLRKDESVRVVVTTSRHVADQASQAGHLAVVERFGARVLTDTCWCMMRAPIVDEKTDGIVTNSAKYAHYAPGLVGGRVHISTLAGCVEAAVTGEFTAERPVWLR